MPAILNNQDDAKTAHLSTRLRRYCGDWLAQFLWAIENGLEEPVNLYAPPKAYNPRARGALDRQSGTFDPDLFLRHPSVAGPELLAYACYLPPEERLGFVGKRVHLYVEDVALLRQTLQASGLLDVWESYKEGGTYQIYSYHRGSGSMQLTPKARASRGIGRAAEVLAEWFERQVLAAD